jgi:hypothetical protein
MIINDVDALPVFVEIDRIRETFKRYTMVPDHVPASLDDIEFAICEEYGVKLEKKTMNFKSQLVRGFIRIFKDPVTGELTAQTVIDSELPPRMTRLVQTKELCHIALMHATNCTDDPTKIIEHFVHDSRVVSISNDDAAPLKNEDLATLAAYELLFPHELRQAAKDRITAGKDTISSIADWLNVPEHSIEYVLGDGYLPFAEHVWGRVRKAQAA